MTVVYVMVLKDTNPVSKIVMKPGVIMVILYPVQSTIPVVTEYVIILSRVPVPEVVVLLLVPVMTGGRRVMSVMNHPGINGMDVLLSLVSVRGKRDVNVNVVQYWIVLMNVVVLQFKMYVENVVVVVLTIPPGPIAVPVMGAPPFSTGVLR